MTELLDMNAIRVRAENDGDIAGLLTFIDALQRSHKDLREATRAYEAEANALAEDLECAEEQWGDDYLWGKWRLSAALNARRARLAAAQEELRNSVKQAPG